MQDGRQIQDGYTIYGSTQSLSFNFKVNQT